MVLKIRLVIILRIAGFFLGGIVAVIATLCGLLWFSFDAQHSAQTLKQYFKEHHQRTLILSAAPRLALWPRPALLLQRSALSEPDSPELFASIEHLRLELAIQPLFHRRFELQGILAEGLSMRLRRDEKDHWNFSSLLEDKQSAPLPDWQSQLSRLEIQRGRFSIEQAGRATPINLQDFGLSARLPGSKPGKLKWQGKLTDTASNSELDIRGNAGFERSAGLSSGSLTRLDLKLDGNLHSIKGASVQLQAERLLWGRQGEEGSIAGLHGLLRGAAGTQSIDLQLGSPDLGWRKHALQGKHFEARLTLRTVDEQSELKLTLPELVAEKEQGFQTEGARLQWQQHKGPLAGSSAQLLLNLQADPLNPVLQLKRIDGEIRLRHPRLQASASQGNLSGTARLERGKHALDLRLALGQDQLQLKAALQQLWPLAGRFDLAASSLNLDRLRARKTPDEALPPLTWPDLAEHNLIGQIKLFKLRTGGVEITRLQGPLRLQNSQLSAEGFRLQVYDGELNGKLQANALNGECSMQGDFRNLQLERLALETDTPIPLTGRISGSYRMNAEFRSGQSPLPSLQGAIRWNLSNGGLRGLDLQRSLRELSPDILARRMSARSPGRDESSELGTASSRFVIEDSRIKAEHIEARSRWLKLEGSGEADMSRSEMDFRLKAALLPGAAAALAPLRGKPLPLRIKGPLLHPDLRYEQATERK